MPLFTPILGTLGATIVLIILWDAFETILVPRRIGRRVRLTRYFYVFTWQIWRSFALTLRKPARREAFIGFYGPLSLILLLTFWAAGLIVAFSLLSLAAHGRTTVDLDSLGLALYMSGETFFTLGYGDVTPSTVLGRVLSVIEAGMGFGFFATVIGYLPTMYAAFSQREIEIALMDARAGSPPTAAEFLRRTPQGGHGELCDELLAAWERWSAQLLETHISYPQLAYYRSQHSNQSWLATLVTILDSTSIMLARTNATSTSQAALTFAAARHALVDITQIFVSRFTPGAPDRLTPEVLRHLREQLAGTPMALPTDDEFELRLAELRLRYEPYAQALAAHLLFELPPWAHREPRRDNWQGGPWDKQFIPHSEAGHRSDEHF